MALNRFEIQGNLTKDVEVRKGPKSNFCFINIAQNQKEGFPTLFFSLIAYGNVADMISKNFSKGDEMLALGRLNVYTDKENKSSTQLVVSEIVFTRGNKKQEYKKEEQQEQQDFSIPQEEKGFEFEEKETSQVDTGITEFGLATEEDLPF